MENIVTLPDGRQFSFPTPQAADEFRRRAGIVDNKQVNTNINQQTTTQQRIQNLESQVVGGQKQTLGDKIKGFGQDLVRPFAQTAVSAEKAFQGIGGLIKAGGQALVGNKEGAKQTIFETGENVNKTENRLGVDVKAVDDLREGIGVGLEVGSWIPGMGAAGASLKLQALAGAKFGAMVGGLSELGRALQEEEATGREILERTAMGTGVGALIGAAFPVVAKGTKTITKSVLGQTTGLGSRNLSAIYKTFAYGTREEMKLATRALRGKSEETLGPLLEEMVAGLNKIRFQRASVYQKQLAKMKGLPDKIDLKPLSTKVDELLGKFNITKNSKGELDFSRSTLSKPEENDIIDMLNDVLGWGSKADDNTVLGLDILKQRIDGYFSKSNKVNLFAKEIKDTITKQLDDVTNKAYSNMKKGYEQASQLASDIEKGLSLNAKNLDTTLKKINSVLKDNQEYRLQLVRELEEYLGRNITGEIAAYQASNIVPQGLAKYTSIGFGSAGITGIISPQFLPLLAASSPRMVGEFVRALGLSNRLIQGLATKIIKSGTSAKSGIIKELQKIMENQGGYMRLPEAGSVNPKLQELERKWFEIQQRKINQNLKGPALKNSEKAQKLIEEQILKEGGTIPKGSGAATPKTAEKYLTTVNIQDKNDLEYLRRILSEDSINDIKNGKMTNWRGTSYEDLAKVNIISETPKTIAQQLEGKIKNVKLKSNTFYHGTSAENADNISKIGFKLGSELPEDVFRGGGYGKIQNSISLSGTPKKASIFSDLTQDGKIIKVKIKPEAKVISINGVDDAIDIEDYIDYLRKQKVDAVYIGGGEDELVIINKDIIIK